MSFAAGTMPAARGGVPDIHAFLYSRGKDGSEACGILDSHKRYYGTFSPVSKEQKNR
jgi:hypothetical protein